MTNISSSRPNPSSAYYNSILKPFGQYPKRRLLDPFTFTRSKPVFWGVRRHSSARLPKTSLYKLLQYLPPFEQNYNKSAWAIHGVGWCLSMLIAHSASQFAPFSYSAYCGRQTTHKRLSNRYNRASESKKVSKKVFIKQQILDRNKSDQSVTHNTLTHHRSCKTRRPTNWWGSAKVVKVVISTQMRASSGNNRSTSKCMLNIYVVFKKADLN